MAFRSYTFSTKLRFRSVIVVLLDSFRFGTENDLEKRQPSSRPRRKNFRRSGNSPRVRGAGHTGRRKAQCGLYQKIAAPLETGKSFASFLPAATCGPGAVAGPG